MDLMRNPSETLVFVMMSRIWKQLSPTQKLKFKLIFSLTALTALAEVTTLGALLPFIGVLVTPHEAFENKYFAYIADVFQVRDALEAVIYLTSAFIIIIILSSLLRICQLWATARASYGVGNSASERLFSVTLSKPFEEQLNSRSSEVISAIGKVHIFVDALSQMVRLISSLVMVLSILVTLIIIDANVAICSFMFFGGAYVVINFSVKVKLRRNSQVIAENRTQVVKVLQEGLGGLREITVSGTKQYFLNLFKLSDYALRRAESNNAIIEGAPRFIMEAFGITFVALLAVFFFVNDGGIAGNLPLLGVLALSAQRMLPALQQAYNAWTAIKGHESSLNELLTVLESEKDQSLDAEDQTTIPFTSQLIFKDVSFSYKSAKKKALNKVNFKIMRGEQVGVVGPTGSGKSTLLDLILGLLEPTGGEIIVDQHTLSKGNFTQWQKNISHVPQTIFLTDGTITENIAFGEAFSEINFDRVLWAAEMACVTDFVSKMPLGLKSIVGERGVMLSGGEVQRIGIARALYKKKPIIVLDEATTALDVNTEMKVLNNIVNLSDKRTLIMVSHRRSSLDNCDFVLSVNEGSVIGL